MRTVVVVALDLLREALARRWILALGLAITLGLAILALGVQLDVVNGALATSRLFGTSLGTDIRAVDVALRPVFEASSYLVSYLGTLFMILACADFGPSLLAPGRIEHLLSLPVRRWELLLGTFLGVWLLSTLAALYGAGGLALILAAKTGHWSAGPVASALLASTSFATLYAAMLTTTLFVRSAAIAAAVGGILFVAGIVASRRDAFAELLHPGTTQDVFLFISSGFPRVGAVADAAATIAAGLPFDSTSLARLLLGMGVFTLAVLAVGLGRFEERDF